jgi:hypothetical protein
LFELGHAEDKAEGRRVVRFGDATIADDERLEHGAVVAVRKARSPIPVRSWNPGTPPIAAVRVPSNEEPAVLHQGTGWR